MSTKDKIGVDVELDLELNKFRRGLNEATKSVHRFGTDLKNSLNTFGGQGFKLVTDGFKAIGVAATAAAAAGLYAFTSAMRTGIQLSAELQTATFNMASSLDAANRQFQVGSIEQWETAIKELGETLRVFSETELRGAASRTIDMTKRLGLSAEQMKKVIQVSGDLGAGKFGLVDSVERVTAALRGEAEASEALGLTLNEDYVKGWYASNNATGKAWKDLTDLEKAQVRYNILLEQASPSLGRAAASINTYAGAVQVAKNQFNDFLIEAGNLVTQNSFVIESLKIAGQMFDEWKESIAGNRDQLVNLVKDGILLLVDGIAASIEALRFFYNGWKGLGLVAHGTVTLIVKMLAALSEIIIDSVLKPLDLVFDAMEKLGVIDTNPLENFQNALDGFADFSAEEFKEMLAGIADTNAKFDDAKKLVSDFKERIKDIPAEYKATAQSIEQDNKQVETTVALIGGQWVQVYKDAEDASDKATRAMLADIKKVKKEISAISYPSSSSADGYATGGDPFFGGLSGYGGGDRRLILVEDGEHVIRKEAVRKFGHGFFQRFNTGFTLPEIPGFATGGAIGAAALSGSGSVLRHEHVIRIGGSAPAMVYSDDINAERLISALKRAGDFAS